MAFDVTAIGTAYDTLFTKITTQLDTLYTAKKIDAETYATLLGQATSGLLIQVGDLIQKQQVTDADVALRDAQIAEINAKIALITEQTESEAKQNAVDGVIDKQILDLVAATELKAAQKATETDKLDTAGIQRDVLAAQESLYTRQEKGFDDNKKLKLFEAQLDVYGMLWSSVGGFDPTDPADDQSAIPTAFSGGEITTLYNSLKA